MFYHEGFLSALVYAKQQRPIRSEIFALFGMLNVKMKGSPFFSSSSVGSTNVIVTLNSLHFVGDIVLPTSNFAYSSKGFFNTNLFASINLKINKIV